MQHVCFLEQEQNNHLKQRKPGYYLELTNCMMKYHLFLYCKLLSPDNRHCKLLSPDIFFSRVKIVSKIENKDFVIYNNQSQERNQSHWWNFISQRKKWTKYFWNCRFLLTMHVKQKSTKQIVLQFSSIFLS